MAKFTVVVHHVRDGVDLGRYRDVPAETFEEACRKVAGKHGLIFVVTTDGYDYYGFNAGTIATSAVVRIVEAIERGETEWVRGLYLLRKPDGFDVVWDDLATAGCSPQVSPQPGDSHGCSRDDQRLDGDG